jgi:HlyD family secretion protein
MEAMLEWARTILAAGLALFVPEAQPEGVYYGYVEAEYQRVASREGGTLLELLVERGATVQAGQVIARFDDTAEAAQVAEALARVAQAGAQLADLRKGSRALEIEALIAQRTQAAAALELSRTTLARQQQLVAEGVLAGGALDEARAAFDRDDARMAELDAQIEAAQLGARDDQVAAADAALAATRAALAQAEWRLDQRVLMARDEARVADTLFVAGEFVPPGMPVVALLLPGNVVLRFYVPEMELGALRIGQRVRFACDGCSEGLAARISWVADEPEFTPPVIFSRESRAKLVFRVEARPDAPLGLHPGQPVEVGVGDGAP